MMISDSFTFSQFFRSFIFLFLFCFVTCFFFLGDEGVAMFEGGTWSSGLWPLLQHIT
jgi:hypothetical protein